MDASAPRPGPSRGSSIWANLGVWTAVGLWSTLTTWASARAAGVDPHLLDHLLYFMPGWLLWVSATWWLYRRLQPPPESHQRLRLLAQVTLFGLTWILAYTVLMAWLELTLRKLPVEHLRQAVLTRFYTWSYIDFVIYGCVALAIYGLSHHLRYLQAARTAAELREQVAKAELRTLRAQLQPHFLFNALSSVSNLIRTRDRSGALSAITGISDLLRDVLEADQIPWRPLADEVTMTERYLEIQTLRFGDRLRPTIAMGPGCETFEVPRLVLQPLVENAVRHGVAPSPRPGWVALHAERQNDRLHLSVTNSRPDPHDSRIADTSRHLEQRREGGTGPGTGLDNLRSRLAWLYDGKARLTVGSSPGDSNLAPRFSATLDLPPRPEAS